MNRFWFFFTILVFWMVLEGAVRCIGIHIILAILATAIVAHYAPDNVKG